MEARGHSVSTQTLEGAAATSPEPAPVKKKETYISLRVKIVGTFVALFSIVFLLVSVWVVQFASQAALDRLGQQLRGQVERSSTTIDGDAFAELVATVPAVPDPADKSGFGYPDSQLYRDLAKRFYTIYQVVDSGTYSWFKDPKDGKLYTAVSSGYYRSPQSGWHYKIPIETVTEPSTYALMEQGLTQTTEEPAYTDAYGSWMSVYTPILDANGKAVGGIGQDISLDYVSEVRAKAVRQVLPVLIGIYIILVVLVWLVATRIVRPIRRLTKESTRIAEGDYDLDLESLTRVRFKDEISTLAESFQIMSHKVAERERTLQVEVKRLTVEINSTKRAESVAAIVDSEGFSELAERAAEMRRRSRE